MPTNEQNNVSTIQSFRNIIQGITLLSGQEFAFSTNEIEKIAISLYDHWLNNHFDTKPNFKICQQVSANLANSDEQIKYLMACLEILDPLNQLSPLIFDNTLDSGQVEFDSKLSALLVNINSTNYRILTLAVFALGKTFRKAGNDKLALHMFNLAAVLQEKVGRSSSRIEIDKVIIRLIFGHAANLALILGYYEQAIESGTKVVMRLDVQLSEVLNGNQPVESFDFDEYYTNLMVLAEAAERGQDYCSAVFAYRNAVELFEMEKKLLGDYGCLLEFIDISEASDGHGDGHGNVRSDSKYQKEILRLGLCLKLINVVNLSDGDAMLALGTARSALAHFALIVDEQNVIKESHLKFLLGRSLYKAALSLAGGANLASSPPVAILSDTKSPTIRELLEEAIEVLEDCRMQENCGKHGDSAKDFTDCQEAVQMQIAVVAMELRQEVKAKSILQNLGMYDDQMAKWDAFRREGSITSTDYSYLATVLYSVEVFKRLLLVAPMSNISKLTSRLTLSSKIMHADSPAKVQCAFCSMKCFNSGIKCETCAKNSIFIWYCSTGNISCLL
jgi:tetratricopeptide (TPR) repeat protein